VFDEIFFSWFSLIAVLSLIMLATLSVKPVLQIQTINSTESSKDWIHLWFLILSLFDPYYEESYLLRFVLLKQFLKLVRIYILFVVWECFKLKVLKSLGRREYHMKKNKNLKLIFIRHDLHQACFKVSNACV